MIFTLVDEGAVTMDACGEHTHIFENHYRHDSDQRNSQRPTSRGKVREMRSPSP